MNITLYVIQGLLACIFFMAGIMKVAKNKETLREKLGDWTDNYSENKLKLIGLLEVLGAIGIVLPIFISSIAILVPIAAIGLSITMIGALILHLKRKEKDKVIVNLILLLLALFIVVGRLYV
ncbi:DoxX family protein [Neotamlana laminarinivorans]|uniref:DoxX family protein n=1 Tax=Neotamlana laminarinivorans TaxID=2883124 RepID=A0A9X1HZH5_9FLAO|nr:DoxX family protein [Tamlana laminarinivorans]MCB4797372.1 DoxX family protein [Tamlana laminarinivorans]